jgi:hypothetical protein
MDKKEIFDVIPIQIGEMYPKKEQIWHFENNSNCSDDKMIEEIKINFERITNYEQGIILKNGMIVGWIK